MISFQNVTKTFPSGKRGVKNLTFEVKEGETLVLLGPSGCGKTTALRLINHLIQPTSGTLLIRGKDSSKLDPIQLRRSIGYAVQHVGLFPHMNIGENIGIVPKLLGWEEEKIEQRVIELMEMVGLNPHQFQERFPNQLSGGQKQRVGVARALAADPSIILMDEPFAALDPIILEQLQSEFLQIQSKLCKTVVFVTHDLKEAVKLGDRIAILEEGKLVQLASPDTIIHKPANTFVDTFFGKDRHQLLEVRS